MRREVRLAGKGQKEERGREAHILRHRQGGHDRSCLFGVLVVEGEDDRRRGHELEGLDKAAHRHDPVRTRKQREEGEGEREREGERRENPSSTSAGAGKLGPRRSSRRRDSSVGLTQESIRTVPFLGGATMYCDRGEEREKNHQGTDGKRQDRRKGMKGEKERG